MDAESGRPLAIAILVNSVPADSLSAEHAVAEDQGAIAADVQQPY
jgi:hypothetical protein